MEVRKPEERRPEERRPEERRPIAFMSYVGLDDEHESGRLSSLRQRLSGEISMQTGQDLPIYHDRTTALWARNWRDRVEGSDDPRTFLISIITPRYFQDQDCRADLEALIQREKRLRRQDLILPIYYVRCPLLDDDVQLARDSLARAIITHQYTDWREFRFEPLDSPELGRALESLAAQISESLERSRVTPRSPLDVVSRVTGINIPRRLPILGGPKDPEPESDEPEGHSEPYQEEPEVEAEPAPEPPTRVVDPMGRQDHVTISEAIDQANPGDRILVRPGIYEEELVLDKALEIVGDGDRTEVVVQAKKGNTVLFKAVVGRVSNLTLRQLDGGDRFCVKIVSGKLTLDGCDISSQSLSCVGICQGAEPELKDNKIHGSNESGVIIYDNGRGILENNEIFGNGLSGVEITTGAAPTLRSNRIFENKEAGIYVYQDGRGTLEDNEIVLNLRAGIRVSNSGNPTLRNNRTSKNAIVPSNTPMKGGGRVEAG